MLFKKHGGRIHAKTEQKLLLLTNDRGAKACFSA